jgi:hypothetical protein
MKTKQQIQKIMQEVLTTITDVATTPEMVVHIQITNAHLVRKCIQEMNTDALYYLLDVERTYQDWQRNEFILKLERVMKKFEADGDTYLNAVQGACGGSCSKGQNGYLFIGNNSKNYMNLLFVEEELQLTDLYECSLFRTQFENLELRKRYYIDNRINAFFEAFNNSIEP